MNRPTPTAAQAEETARRIHAEHLVIDSLAPSFVDEWALTPAMLEIGKALQAQGGSRPAIKKAMAEHLIAQCAHDPQTRDTYLRTGGARGSRHATTPCTHPVRPTPPWTRPSPARGAPRPSWPRWAGR